MSQAQVERTLNGFAFTWPESPLSVRLSRIRESSRGTTAELEVHLVNGARPKTLTHQTLNLLTSKDRLAKELQKRHDAPWTSMLEQVCVLTLRELRKGEPVDSLEPDVNEQPAGFVLNPLLYEQHPTVLYGPGDSMKSLFALYCGMLLASGKSGPNLWCAPEPWRVLFLDWEMSVRDLRSRVSMLRHGDPRLTKAPDYRRCYQPLAHDVEELKKVISEGGYDVLILDSLAMAAGGQELEKADSAIQFNAALRSLNCTSLIIGHTPKPNEEQKERSLYGSVFFHNLCRVSWEVRREGQAIGLYHKKNNLGPSHDPMGFHLELEEACCRVTESDMRDSPELFAGCPLKDRIEQALREQPRQTVQELASMLNAKPASLRSKLNQYKKLFFQNDGKWDVLI